TLREPGEIIAKTRLCRAVIARHQKLVSVAIGLFRVAGRRKSSDGGVIGHRQLRGCLTADHIAILVERDVAKRARRFARAWKRLLGIDPSNTRWIIRRRCGSLGSLAVRAGAGAAAFKLLEAELVVFLHAL